MNWNRQRTGAYLIYESESQKRGVFKNYDEPEYTEINAKSPGALPEQESGFFEQNAKGKELA